MFCAKIQPKKSFKKFLSHIDAVFPENNITILFQKDLFKRYFQENGNYFSLSHKFLQNSKYLMKSLSKVFLYIVILQACSL